MFGTAPKYCVDIDNSGIMLDTAMNKKVAAAEAAFDAPFKGHKNAGDKQWSLAHRKVFVNEVVTHLLADKADDITAYKKKDPKTAKKPKAAEVLDA